MGRVHARLISLVFLATGLGAVPAIATPQFEVLQSYLAGSQLRLIVETSVSRQWIPDSPQYTSDAKGWLLLIDLSSNRPIRERASVVGPLWDEPDEVFTVGGRSHHTFVGPDGVIFYDDEWKAGNVPTFFSFDRDGELVRIKDKVCYRLSLGGGTADWVVRGPYTRPPEEIPRLDEDALQCASHHYELRRDPKHGKVTLYETLTGTPITSPWITAAFSRYRSMSAIGHVTAFLSENLDCLVCFPGSIFNPNDTPSIYQTGGHSYVPMDSVFWFRPPSIEPVFVSRPQVENSYAIHGIPSFMVMIGKRPWVAFFQEGGFVLQCVGGPERIEAKTKGLTNWNPVLEPGWQHIPEKDSIVFFCWSYGDKPGYTYIWNYRTGGISKFETNIRELFRSFLGGPFRPVRRVPPHEGSRAFVQDIGNSGTAPN